MTGRAISSLSNPTVKAVRALHLRKAREETGLFLAEGLKIVTEAVELGHAPHILLHGPEAREHPLLASAARAARSAGGEVIEVTRDVLEKVSRRENPQTVVGVFAQAFAPLESLEPAAASGQGLLHQPGHGEAGDPLGIDIGDQEPGLVRQQLGAQAHQLGQVLVQPPDLAARAAPVFRRVQDDPVVARAAADLALDIAAGVLADPTDGAIGQAGQLGVLPRPAHRSL